jgi:hypothetical protein
MFDSIPPAHLPMRRRPLAGCLAAVLCLTAPAAGVAATTWTVDTCNDASAGSGTTGSLRYVAANAASGDSVDMTGLACSTISLSTGAITFAQADITLNGPGKDALSISGNHNDRVLSHMGTGTLAVNDLTVTAGYDHPPFEMTAKGGCIHSNGSVSLDHVAVLACRASAVGAPVRGGGVFAYDSVFAKYSDISGNVAVNSGTNVNGGGGGIFSYGDVVLASSTLDGNSAQTGSGGGVRTFRNSVTIASTISGNIAGRGGGIYAQDNLTSGDDTFTLYNSTLSGNSATSVVGGAWSNAGTIHVYNSTVAFNTAGVGTAYSRHYSPGFAISDIGANGTSTFKTVRLQSSVFSNNAYGTPATTPDDIGVVKFTPASTNSTPTSGENNLAFATTIIGIPNTLTQGVCPGLGPLRDNGGPTRTHALSHGSPAIDAGNVSGNGIGIFDQRGAPFARVSGTAADIGAHEVQQGEAIFFDDFDGPSGCSG